MPLMTMLSKDAVPEAGLPARPGGGFYYGWVIVIVMAVTGGVSMALGGLNFGLFIKPIGDELGIGRATFGWAQSARQLASALTAPLVGNLLDRFGARAMLAVAALLTGLALGGFWLVTAGWEIVALFALTGLVGLNGPGALVTSVPVTRWFVRKRGKAMAMASLGVPLGGFLFVPLTQILIDVYGWRMTCVILGALGALTIAPLSLIFLRRQPEDLGLLPDGAAVPVRSAVLAGANAAPRPLHDPHEERSWTRAEAIRTQAFWRLIVVFSLVMLAVSSVGVHRIPSFMDRGLDPHLISYGTALDAAAAGFSTFVLGLMTRRVQARFLGAGGFVLLAAASALSIVADSHPVMFVAMVSFGLGIGAMILIQNYVWADYFGRRYQGSIRGAVTPITLACSGAGPPIAGYVRDVTGSYSTVWLVATGLMVFGALLLATTRPPTASAPR